MSEDEQTLRERLDERYALILQAIAQRGGTASTSDIKALTGIQTNQIITQRMDRLAEWDLVTVSYRRETDNPKQLPTKVATLTLYGQQTAESGLLDDLVYREDRVDDVDTLNRRMRTQNRRIDQQEARLRAVERFLTEEANVDLERYRQRDST